MAQQTLNSQGLFTIEILRLHSDTPHSVELFWTSDQLIAETYTWQQTTLTREISMPPVGFKPAILASERTQRHILDSAATGAGKRLVMTNNDCKRENT
jgi:hypothetical protein